MLELKQKVNSPCKVVVLRAATTSLWESTIKEFIRLTWRGTVIHGNVAKIMGKKIIFIPLGRDDKMKGLEYDHLVHWREDESI